MLGIPFRVIPPDVDEHVLPGEKPDAYVTRPVSYTHLTLPTIYSV